MFLSSRGLKVGGSKEELVSRAFVAWEQNIAAGKEKHFVLTYHVLLKNIFRVGSQ